MERRLKDTRPKLTAEQLVAKLENEKGIAFNIINHEQAILFLQTKNNYFRIISYKKNYCKTNEKYKNMEFAYLVELSKLDMYLRTLIINTCIDIEHSLKVIMLHDIEINKEENGYDIVENFLKSEKNSFVLNDIKRKSQSHYCGELANHYFNYQYFNGEYEFDFPVWAFLELISFGTLVNFYIFYYDKYGSPPIKFQILNSIKSLRNACAHNNCILHDLTKNTNTAAPYTIINYIEKNPSIGSTARRKKLTNQFILEFSSLLYGLDKIVSIDVKKGRKKEFKKFANERLTKNISYFNNNLCVKSSIEFLKKFIDFF